METLAHDLSRELGLEPELVTAVLEQLEQGRDSAWLLAHSRSLPDSPEPETLELLERRYRSLKQPEPPDALTRWLEGEQTPPGVSPQLLRERQAAGQASRPLPEEEPPVTPTPDPPESPESPHPLLTRIMIGSGIMAVLLAVFYFGIHIWRPATCQEPEICAVCRETRAPALGHLWQEPQCRTPETCRRCGQTQGEALGHHWEKTTRGLRICRRCTLEEPIDPPEVVILKAGDSHTVGIWSHGRALALGEEEAEPGRLAVEDWDNLVDIVSATYHTVGLRADGTVVATGFNGQGQCQVEQWRDIVAIRAGVGCTLGLRADGTVEVAWKPMDAGDPLSVASSVETGQPAYLYSYDYGLETAKTWTQVTDLQLGIAHVVGLRADGTVVAAGDNFLHQCETDQWRDVVSIVAAGNYTLGLRSDGTVVSAGSGDMAPECFRDWKDVVAIYGNDNHVLGLRGDGTILVAGNLGAYVYPETVWKDLVALSPGEQHVVGLRSDGTVVATGLRRDGQCDVGDWKDVVAISAGRDYTLAICSDGTLLSTLDTGRGDLKGLEPPAP